MGADGVMAMMCVTLFEIRHTSSSAAPALARSNDPSTALVMLCARGAACSCMKLWHPMVPDMEEGPRGALAESNEFSALELPRESM